MTKFLDRLRKAYGVAPRESGSQSAPPNLDPGTGSWVIATKSAHALLHLSATNESLECVVPPQPDRFRLGQINFSSLQHPWVIGFNLWVAAKDGPPNNWRLASEHSWGLAFRLSQASVELVKKTLEGRSISAIEMRLDPTTGLLCAYAIGQLIPCEYDASALMLNEARNSPLGFDGITYGDATEAIASFLKVQSESEAGPNGNDGIAQFELTQSGVGEFHESFFRQRRSDPPRESTGPLDASPLIGLDSNLPMLIRDALKVKRHLILHGPPGTGKTTLARKIAEWLESDWVMVTATSDWTSTEVVGGYMPDGSGGIRFEPGFVLRNFEKTIIIDEFNRADIDRAFGPLFSTLSDQRVMLPYAANPADLGSPRVQISPIPRTEPDLSFETYRTEWAPTNNWRLICTLNTYDKATLFQMSHALMRRFAWIYVGIPDDLGSFIDQWSAANGVSEHPLLTRTNGAAAPIELIWQATNAVRPIGPAPIIDVLKFAHEQYSANGLPNSARSWKVVAIDAMMLFVVPLMEGISESDADEFVRHVGGAIGVESDNGLLQSAMSSLGSLVRAHSV